jgi:hypothetical protein
MPERYRKKPVVIEAMQLTMNNVGAAGSWIAEHGGQAADVGGSKPHVYIDTLEGMMVARVGDWIIKGVAGEFYPCRADIFAATYELVKP